jgi:hypothetical protein
MMAVFCKMGLPKIVTGIPHYCILEFPAFAEAGAVADSTSIMYPSPGSHNGNLDKEERMHAVHEGKERDEHIRDCRRK